MANRAQRRRRELAEEIVTSLLRRNSTATVLLHHAIAERLGLGPTDHKCLDLLHERGPMTGRDLAAVTGLTSGAISGVVARLESAGYVDRRPDPNDRRKQILSPRPNNLARFHEVFRSLRRAADSLVEGFDDAELAVIAEFLRRATGFASHQSALLRTQSLTRVPAQSLAPEESHNE
jgi:DNA-binding MarR family transcriptional regulator